MYLNYSSGKLNKSFINGENFNQIFIELLMDELIENFLK
jgi:hypothetical protein